MLRTAPCLAAVLLFAACGADSDDRRDDRSGSSRFSDDRRGDSDEDSDDEDSDEEANDAEENDADDDVTDGDGTGGSDDDDGAAGPGTAPADDDDEPAGSPQGGGSSPSTPPTPDDSAADEDAPVDPCSGIPVGGACEVGLLIRCEAGQPAAYTCGDDATCVVEDGVAGCMTNAALVWETETPGFYCEGPGAPFWMLLNDGQVATFDEADVEVDGTYIVGEEITFDVPGRLVGALMTWWVAADMVLAMTTADTTCWVTTYAFDDGIDASYDCGTTSWSSGSYMEDQDFVFTAQGGVLRHLTTDIYGAGYADTLYDEQPGAYRIDGGRVIMAFIDDDTTVVVEATLDAAGNLTVPSSADPGCTRL